MDTNTNPKFTNTIWELGMAMDQGHVLHDPLPLDSLIWPNYLPQTHHIPSSSSSTPIQFPTSHVFITNQIVETHHHHMKVALVDQEEDEVEAAEQEPEEELGAMKEMMYKIASMQPVDIDPATIRRPKRRNVRISDDPQSVAARHRRERISEKIRILQRLVPGGTKMDTASMLDEAIRYVKFLKRQIRQLQSNHHPLGLGHVSNRGEWPVVTQNKALGFPAVASCTMEPPGGLGGYGFGGDGTVRGGDQT